MGISSEHAAQVLEALLSRAVIGVTLELFQEALVLQSRFMLSYWDAAIIAAAALAGCQIVYSEDMSHLQIYGRVMVINLFAEGGR